uniref:Uncharacterized protein n=1 Tax=Sciurus vulgaris TaxID=55149 RepID=A0A8D2DVL7_SCIVU
MPKKAGVKDKDKSQSKEPERLLHPLDPVIVDPKGPVTAVILDNPSCKPNVVTDFTNAVANVGTAMPPSEVETTTPGASFQGLRTQE